MSVFPAIKQSYWTKARIDLLTELWNGDRHTATEIAKLMVIFTRSAIIGKAYRLGLKRKAKSNKGSQSQKLTTSQQEFHLLMTTPFPVLNRVIR